MPSIWPLIRWPPRASPTRNASSRFTDAPAGNPVVHRSVSAEASKSNVPDPFATTVRQQPFTATLSPTRVVRRSRSPVWTPTRTPSPCDVLEDTRPTACTIPVNTMTSLRTQNARDQPQVRTDAVDRQPIKRDAFIQRGQRRCQLEHAARRVAQHARGNV